MKPLNRLRIIFIQSLLAMMGSLYFSNFGDPITNIKSGNIFGGAGFEPCHLCRRARILMYPLVLISIIGLLRKDKKVAYTILPISILGIILTSYHYIIQYVNSLNTLTCIPSNPCILINRELFGFLTIPALALIAFIIITIGSISIITSKEK